MSTQSNKNSNITKIKPAVCFFPPDTTKISSDTKELFTMISFLRKADEANAIALSQVIFTTYKAEIDQMNKSDYDEFINLILTKCKSEIHKAHAEWITRPNAQRGFHEIRPSWLPGYTIEYGIESVPNASKLHKVISEENFNLLAVPEQFLFRIYNGPDPVSNLNTVVVTKRIGGFDNELSKLTFAQIKQIKESNRKLSKLNLAQTKQLCKLALGANHYNIHPENLVFADKIYITDTSVAAMPAAEEQARLHSDWVLNGTRLHDGGGIRMNPDIINDPLTKMELAMYCARPYYDDDAYAYLGNLINAREAYRKSLV